MLYAHDPDSTQPHPTDTLPKRHNALSRQGLNMQSSPTPGSADSLFQHRAYIAFWCARTASSFGFQMLSVAVGWQIYAMTGRAFDLGLIGLVQFFPSVLLALPAGHLADQLDRRRIVLIGQIVEWVAIVVLATLTLLHAINEVGILLLIFTISVAKAFESPSMQSMVPALVPPSLLPRAMAVNGSAMQAAMIMGPALGGFLYVAGPGVVYSVSAVLYLIAATMVAQLHYEQAPPKREPATLKTLFAGVHFIRERKDVLGVISLDLFAVLLGGATALLPIFAKDVLHTGPWGLGLLRAAPAVGALLMSFWLARNSMERRVGMIMFACVAGFGVATLAMITVHHLNNSRSQRILWLLEELGVPYEIKRYQRDPKTMLAPPELRATMHPLGKSPVITDGDSRWPNPARSSNTSPTVTAQGRLLPTAGTPERLRCNYWLHYAEGSAMPPLLLKLVFRRVETAPVPFFVRPVAKGIAHKVQTGFVDPQLKLHLDYLEGELARANGSRGNDFSVADIQLSFPLEAFAARGGLDATSRPRVDFCSAFMRGRLSARAGGGGEYSLGY
jgi:glutathione S-transferase/MFS family permease